MIIRIPCFILIRICSQDSPHVIVLNLQRDITNLDSRNDIPKNMWLTSGKTKIKAQILLIQKAFTVQPDTE